MRLVFTLVPTDPARSLRGLLLSGVVGAALRREDTTTRSVVEPGLNEARPGPEFADGGLRNLCRRVGASSGFGSQTEVEWSCLQSQSRVELVSSVVSSSPLLSNLTKYMRERDKGFNVPFEGWCTIRVRLRVL